MSIEETNRQTVPFLASRKRKDKSRLHRAWTKIRRFLQFPIPIIILYQMGILMLTFVIVFVAAVVSCAVKCVANYVFDMASSPARVKSVDFHSKESWAVVAFYSGCVVMFDIEKPTEPILSVKVSHLPVRCVKFVEKKQWFITGSDDMYVRVYKHTSPSAELVREFQAHDDYIRSVEVHSTSTYLLTASDDMMIKQWDMENDFALTHQIVGHSHYVMQVKFHPQDAGTFASASLDGCVKIWTLGSKKPCCILEDMRKG